jgi:hypothetical protein
MYPPFPPQWLLAQMYPDYPLPAAEETVTTTAAPAEAAPAEAAPAEAVPVEEAAPAAENP